MDASPVSRSTRLTLMLLAVILTTVGQVGPGATADLPVLTLPPAPLVGFCRVAAGNRHHGDPGDERLRHHGGQGRQRSGRHETAGCPTHRRPEKISERAQVPADSQTGHPV